MRGGQRQGRGEAGEINEVLYLVGLEYAVHADYTRVALHIVCDPGR